MNCYNCGGSDHKSRNCNKSQNFARCGHCNNVCVRVDSHKVWCQNKNFISCALQPFEVVQMSTKFLSLYSSEEIAYVFDQNGPKLINTGLPMVISNVNLIVQKVDANTFKLYSFGIPKPIRLSIADSEHNNRFYIYVNEEKFTVNNQIRVLSNGEIVLREEAGNIFRSENLHFLTTTNAERIDVKISRFGTYGFTVGRDYTIIDPG